MNLCKILLFTLGICTSSSLLATVTHSVGIARDAKDQSIRYIEHHQYLPSGEHLVKYYDPEGTVMVTKTITYPGLPQHPEINQTDFTKDTKIVTTNTANSATMVRTMSGVNETLVVALDEATIIDAGFDSFLKSQWTRFSAGESKIFRLAVAGKQSLLKIRITKQQTKDKNTTFKIEPHNFFVRMLVPEMLLTYGPDRQLLTYQGLTNLNLPADQDRDVVVAFSQHTSPEPLGLPLPHWLPKK